MGRIVLFFGCQYKSMELYQTDKVEMINEHVLDKTYLALSREPSIPKVQHGQSISINNIMKFKTNKTIYYFII